MGFNSRQVNIVRRVTPVVDTSIYASLDALHDGYMTFSNVLRGHNASGSIKSLSIIDNAKQAAVFRVAFFSKPLASTITKNVALTLLDADLANLLGIVEVVPLQAVGTVGIPYTAYTLFANNAAYTMSNINLSVVNDESPNARHIYAVAQVVTSTPTYVAANDVTFVLGMTQD